MPDIISKKVKVKWMMTYEMIYYIRRLLLIDDNTLYDMIFHSTSLYNVPSTPRRDDEYLPYTSANY